MTDFRLKDGDVIKLKYGDYDDYIIVKYRDEDDFKVWCNWLTRNSAMATHRVSLVWITDAEAQGDSSNPEMELLSEKEALEVILKSKL